MLLSMTGFGQGQREGNGLLCSVEMRSVNNRFLKVTMKLPDSHGALESDLEKLVRERVRRGTVSVFVRIDRLGEQQPYRLNERVLRGYLTQLKGIVPHDSTVIGHLLALPGVVEESIPTDDSSENWPIVQQAALAALENFDKMRRDEGAMMQQELVRCCDDMTGLLQRIEARSPEVVKAYRDRLHERIKSLLAEHGVSLDPTDLIKEVSIFAERSDIAEEIVRLRSHLSQFHETTRSEDCAGRKLEFLTQEMHRETNTIGSKANDVEIAQLVVDLKSQVERVREIIQNIE